MSEDEVVPPPPYLDSPLTDLSPADLPTPPPPPFEGSPIIPSDERKTLKKKDSAPRGLKSVDISEITEKDEKMSKGREVEGRKSWVKKESRHFSNFSGSLHISDLNRKPSAKVPESASKADYRKGSAESSSGEDMGSAPLSSCLHHLEMTDKVSDLSEIGSFNNTAKILSLIHI